MLPKIFSHNFATLFQFAHNVATNSALSRKYYFCLTYSIAFHLFKSDYIAVGLTMIRRQKNFDSRTLANFLNGN